MVKQKQVWMGRHIGKMGLPVKDAHKGMATMQHNMEEGTVKDTHQVDYGTQHVSGRGSGQPRAMVDIMHNGYSHLAHADAQPACTHC